VVDGEDPTRSHMRSASSRYCGLKAPPGGALIGAGGLPFPRRRLPGLDADRSCSLCSASPPQAPPPVAAVIGYRASGVRLAGGDLDRPAYAQSRLLFSKHPHNLPMGIGPTSGYRTVLLDLSTGTVPDKELSREDFAHRCVASRITQLLQEHPHRSAPHFVDVLVDCGETHYW
jgi:hypothetical protein